MEVQTPDRMLTFSQDWSRQEWFADWAKNQAFPLESVSVFSSDDLAKQVQKKSTHYLLVDSLSLSEREVHYATDRELFRHQSSPYVGLLVGNKIPALQDAEQSNLSQVLFDGAELALQMSYFRVGGRKYASELNRFDRIKSLVHDLNNPLTVILGLSWQLMNSKTADGVSKEKGDKIHLYSERIHSVLKDVQNTLLEEKTKL